MVHVAYALSHPLNKGGQLSSGATVLNFGLILYFVYTSREGSGKTINREYLVSVF